MGSTWNDTRAKKYLQRIRQAHEIIHVGKFQTANQFILREDRYELLRFSDALIKPGTERFYFQDF